MSEQVFYYVHLIKISTKFGEEFLFTNHSSNITLNQETFTSITSLEISNIRTTKDLEIDNFHFEMEFKDTIEAMHIQQGLLDYAKIELYILNLQSTKLEKIHIKTGHIGEIILLPHKFQAEVKTISEKLTSSFGHYYSSKCRASFGDKKCKIDSAKFSFTTKIDKIRSKKEFTIKDETKLCLKNGKLILINEENIHKFYEIKNYDTYSKKIILYFDIQEQIHENDEIHIVAGCDKQYRTCCNLYQNVENFRGEPFIPGINKILSFY